MKNLKLFFVSITFIFNIIQLNHANASDELDLRRGFSCYQSKLAILFTINKNFISNDSISFFLESPSIGSLRKTEFGQINKKPDIKGGYTMQLEKNKKNIGKFYYDRNQNIASLILNDGIKVNCKEQRDPVSDCLDRCGENDFKCMVRCTGW